MDLSPKKLEIIEDLSSVCMSPKEIAIILDVDTANFLNEVIDETSEAYRAMQKGFLKTKLKYQRDIFSAEIEPDIMCEQKKMIDNFNSQLIRDINS